MSEISLQAYENEIDQLTEQARYIEALAHIRHLLSQFPHYVGAYYLLGKTMLEAELPDLAVDAFRRALSADPEYLMARIGLGLAHERRNDLDAALWNLERALELDPGNNDVAEELRRMYGRRDGVELAYVPQTRAGLANLYLRGRRYGRAAEELSALLEEQPARPDLMTLLAEAHWRNGQLVQASEAAQALLDLMPYNCKANLLLGALWVNSGQEEGWTYLRRAQEVDPASHHANELFGSDSLLEFSEVSLDRLSYDPDAVDVDQESDWFRRLRAASITTGISEAPPEMTEAEVRLVDITAGLESQIEIPDWLRELGPSEGEDESPGGLGWMADVGLEEPTKSSEDALIEVEDQGALEAVGGLEAGLGTEGEPDLGEVEEEAEETPDWLQELTSQDSAMDLGETEGAPDWLMELAGEEQPAREGEPFPETPERLEGTGEAEVGVAGESADWLPQFATAEGDLTAEPALGVTVEEGFSLGSAEEALPDWLGELQSSIPDEMELEEEVSPALMGDESLASISEGEEEELASAEVPDWLTELQPEAVGEPEVAGADDREVPTADTVPEWLDGLESAAGVPEAEGAETAAEEVPDWLAELAPDTGATEAEGVEAAVEEVPDWLAELRPEAAAEPEGVEAGETEIPAEDAALDWLAKLEPGVSVAEVEDAQLDQEEIPDWLAGLEPGAGASEDESTEVAPEDVPDWLRELEPVDTDLRAPAADISGPEASEEEEGVLSGEDALAWIESLTAAEDLPVKVQAETESSVERVADTVGEAPVAEDLAGPEAVAAPIGETVVEMAEIDASSEEGELISGDDALALLESLTVGKEDELRARVEEESAERVAEILGRKRESPAESATVSEETPEPELSEAEAPEMIEESAPVAGAADTMAGLPLPQPPEIEMPSETGDLLSGDDALAWLESLAAGKEDELRAQVEEESAERVAEILGRRREKPVVETEAAELVDAAVPEVAASVDEPSEAEPEASVVEEQPVEVVAIEAPDHEASGQDIPSEEGQLLSGDDALAWLESMSVGEEEELPAQAEQESEERVTEILGREPAVLAAGPPPVEMPSVKEEISEVESLVDVSDLLAMEIAPPDEQKPELPGSEREAPKELPAEITEVSQVEVPSLVEEILPEVETFAGEDARAWLENLTPEEESALQAEVEEEGAGEALVEEAPGETFFGWSAFSGTPEEITPSDAVEEGEGVDEAAVELEVESETRTALLEVGPDQGEQEAAPAVEPAAVAEPLVEPELAVVPPTEPEFVDGTEPPRETEAVVMPVIDAQMAEPRLAATATETVDADLEAMRAHVKQKRSDHAARLALARALWEVGEIDEAMPHYARLIKSRTKPDDVTRDLERYAEEKPDGPGVLRTLGDAYMKFGELDKALDIYNRAMNQL